MVSVFASSVIYRVVRPDGVELKTNHASLRRNIKDGLAQISIMCLSGATSLPVDCCFSKLALRKFNKRFGLVQIRKSFSSNSHCIQTSLLKCTLSTDPPFTTIDNFTADEFRNLLDLNVIGYFRASKVFSYI
jgi:hypothetical protein